jgi:hypothetical protein
VALTNTILVSHGVGISVTAGNTVTLEGTLWGAGDWANGLDWGGDGTITTGTVNLWGDPAFVDPDAADYHIGPSSVAIDVGVNAGVVTDIDGDLRPDRCFPDLGSDEFITGIQCKRIFLPLVVRTYLGTTGPHNRPPNLPFSPVPADNAINQSVDINLKWSGGDPDADSVTYDVFLEEDDSTPDRLACNNAANALCDPGTLNDGTYFWRVIARDEHGATRAGPVWEFDARWTLSNDPPWHGAVVNVVPGNHMGQSFVPFASVLRSVAFDVLTMNPGRGGDTLTMRIRSEDGAVMATASRYLEEGFNGWLSFELENGGIRVTPEQTLILELEDTGKVVFGWKYGRDTYADGSAIFFGSFRTDRDFFFRVNY